MKGVSFSTPTDVEFHVYLNNYVEFKKRPNSTYEHSYYFYS